MVILIALLWTDKQGQHQFCLSGPEDRREFTLAGLRALTYQLILSVALHP